MQHHHDFTQTRLTVNETTYLRPLDVSDANAFFKLIDTHRKQLEPWVEWMRYLTQVEACEGFLEEAQLQMEAGVAIHFGAEFEGNLVGMINIPGMDHLNRCANLGYWLSPQVEGRGLAGQAVCVLADFVFMDLKFNRIEIRTPAHNKRSIKLAQRLGWRSEGIAREAEWLGDRFVDIEIFSMLLREWIEKR